jgi:hypothetical protein
MWLAFASLYILRSEYWLTVITLGGILVAFVCWRAGLPVVLAQAIASVLAAVGAVVIAAVILARLGRRNPHRSRFLAPRTSELSYLAWPYFLYGTIYFVFIFLDRIVAWSTTGAYMPYYIWFRGEYELGLDWALLALVLPLCATEVLIHYVNNWLQAAQRAVRAAQAQRLVRGLRGVYLQCLIAGAFAAVAGWMLTQAAIGWARHVPLLAGSTPSTPIETFTFQVGTLAYVLLAVGLFNVLVMFSLLVPWPAMRLLGIAMALDFVVGMVLTRTTGHYQYAAWGLLAGTAFLAIASTREVLRLAPQIDYLLFRMV